MVLGYLFVVSQPNLSALEQSWLHVTSIVSRARFAYSVGTAVRFHRHSQRILHTCMHAYIIILKTKNLTGLKAYCKLTLVC